MVANLSPSGGISFRSYDNHRIKDVFKKKKYINVGVVDINFHKNAEIRD